MVGENVVLIGLVCDVRSIWVGNPSGLFSPTMPKGNTATFQDLMEGNI